MAVDEIKVHQLPGDHMIFADPIIARTVGAQFAACLEQAIEKKR